VTMMIRGGMLQLLLFWICWLSPRIPLKRRLWWLSHQKSLLKRVPLFVPPSIWKMWGQRVLLLRFLDPHLLRIMWVVLPVLTFFVAWLFPDILLFCRLWWKNFSPWALSASGFRRLLEPLMVCLFLCLQILFVLCDFPWFLTISPFPFLNYSRFGRGQCSHIGSGSWT
jgi:hypothetical protein